MTATLTAATRIRDAIGQLDIHDRNALYSDDGLSVDVDGAKVAVWHREDGMIVAFTSPDGDTEEWTELNAVSFSHATVAAWPPVTPRDLLTAGGGSQADGTYTWSDIIEAASKLGTVDDEDFISGEIDVDVDGVRHIVQAVQVASAKSRP